MGDLKNLFKKERLSPRTKIKLALDCAAAMYHLHLQRVLHCVCFFYFIVLLSLPWCHNQTHSGLFLTGPGMQKHIGYHCTGRIYCKGYRYVLIIKRDRQLGLIILFRFWSFQERRDVHQCRKRKRLDRNLWANQMVGSISLSRLRFLPFFMVLFYQDESRVAK